MDASARMCARCKACAARLRAPTVHRAPGPPASNDSAKKQRKLGRQYQGNALPGVHSDSGSELGAAGPASSRQRPFQKSAPRRANRSFRSHCFNSSAVASRLGRLPTDAFKCGVLYMLAFVHEHSPRLKFPLFGCHHFPVCLLHLLPRARPCFQRVPARRPLSVPQLVPVQLSALISRPMGMNACLGRLLLHNALAPSGCRWQRNACRFSPDSARSWHARCWVGPEI